MQIRNEQLSAFQDTSKQGYEDEMTAHLRDFSPPLFEAAGEDQIRIAIRLGMSRAAGEYGFSKRGPVRLYLEMMLLFGSYFDTDPQYPWAAELLASHDGEQMQRAEQLYEKTMEYRRAVAGEEDAHTLRALRMILRVAEGELPPARGDIEAVLEQRISAVYPEKARFVGPDAMAALIREGLGAASEYKFSTERAQTLMVVLMLAFGYGCARDPLYPWIGRTLKDAAITTPEARAKRLESKAVTWLRQALAQFGAADL